MMSLRLCFERLAFLLLMTEGLARAPEALYPNTPFSFYQRLSYRHFYHIYILKPDHFVLNGSI
jgi:hypothetical protein